jgi:hypothetical protein
LRIQKCINGVKRHLRACFRGDLRAAGDRHSLGLPFGGKFQLQNEVPHLLPPKTIGHVFRHLHSANLGQGPGRIQQPHRLKTHQSSQNSQDYREGSEEAQAGQG